MSKTKRALSLILTVALLLTCAPHIFPTASAATSGYYTYSVSGGEAKITDVDTAISGKVTVPATLGGYPVTSIYEWAFSQCKNITAVTVGSNIKTIGRGAFYHCENLTTAVISDSVTTMEPQVFAYCYKLTSVTLGNGITRIGKWTFTHCTGLVSIVIPKNVTSLGMCAFSDCTSLQTVTIPAGLLTLESQVFDGCSNLSKVYYGGTKTQSDSMEIDLWNMSFENATWYYSSVCYHSYGNWVKQNDTYHKRTCVLCQKDAQTATHTWNSGVVTQSATCTKTGIRTYTCSTCGGTKTETISTNNTHSYSSVVTPPTCTDQGYTTYTCTACGYNYKSNYVTANSHTYGEWSKLDDNQHQRTCTVCKTHTQTASHTWDDGAVTEEPNCKDVGKKVYCCSTCGATKTETLWQTEEHIYGKWEKVDNGNHKRTCTVCLLASETEIHIWNPGTIKTPATCTEDEVRTYRCIYCEAERDEVIPGSAKGHDYGKWTSVDDNDHCRVCTVCKTHTETDVHNWDEGIVTKKPTCNKTGIKIYTCVTCGGTKTETLKITDEHILGEWESVDDIYHQNICPECTLYTITEKHSIDTNHICTVCRKTLDAEHSWDEGVLTKKATCKEDGIITYTCCICTVSTTETIPMIKFADVVATGWQFEPAAYVYDRGLMAGKGTDANGKIKFDPNSPITREEFVQVLYNAEGKPAYENDKIFPDVQNAWYKNAVLWANSQNIANGLGDGSFGVVKNITRQDLALMLYKYASLKGVDLTAEEGRIDAFADGDKVSGYAKTAMNWAVKNGVLSGKGTAGADISTFRLDPAGTATRAECAAMLKNFMTAFGL